MDPFTLRDDDCWECIAEEMAATDPDLAQQLRDALNDPMRNHRGSALALFTTTYHVQIDMAARSCLAQLRCSH
jgi:hypothetical protein